MRAINWQSGAIINLVETSAQMIRVERAIKIAVTQKEAFEYVANHGNTRAFMHNIRRFEPRGEKPYGLGARFYWQTVYCGLKLGCEFVVTDFEPYTWMAAKGLSVPRSTSSWFFEPADGGTVAILSVGYEIPRALVPKWLGGMLVQRELATNIDRSLANLKVQLEAMPRPVTSPSRASSSGGHH